MMLLTYLDFLYNITTHYDILTIIDINRDSYNSYQIKDTDLVVQCNYFLFSSYIINILILQWERRNASGQFL